MTNDKFSWGAHFAHALLLGAAAVIATVGAQVSGTGITLTAALTGAHASGAQVACSLPTPGAPNQYYRRRR